MYKIIFFFSLLVLSVCMIGCAQEDQLKSTVTFEEFQKVETQDSNKTQEKLKHAEADVQEVFEDGAQLEDDNRGGGAVISQADYMSSIDMQDDYILGPGDLVELTVFETSDLNTQARVSSRGYVSLPLLNQIHVQGLTAGEAEEKVEGLLRANYLHDPHVTLFIKERVSQQITLVGEVNIPGTYEFINSKTILDMIALAGGLADSAGDIAYVSRKPSGGEDTEKQIYLVDLYQLITKGKIDMNMPMYGGDVVFIPKAGLVHVDGAVHDPGAFKLEPEMTIDKAIAAAGGFQVYADTDDIKLIRHNDQGRRDIIQLSIQDIRTAANDTLLLKSDDVVFVEISGTKTFFSGFGFNLGFLGTGLSYDSPVE